MHFHRSLSLVLLATTRVLCASSTPNHRIHTDLSTLAVLANKAYEQTRQHLRDLPEKRDPDQPGTDGCNLRNLRVRREWGTLSKAQRKQYIRAVKILHSKPARTPASVAAGAKTRFDDFLVTHIQQTPTIHYTANFLSWHRYFTWVYEEALREEGGYRGAQPYWDWAKTAQTGLLSSPIFDGSDSSMGGNGAYAGNHSDMVLGPSAGFPPLYLPTGSGGGCVASGPFKNLTVNLGPLTLDLPGGGVETAPSGNALDWNPRCLKRDLVDYINQRFANASSVLSQILKPQNVYDFQLQMQAVPGTGELGVHGGGHYAIGGDPARDVAVSPGDPIFYLHHAQIDRVWWIWQTLKPQERICTQSAIAGTRTFFNKPPSPNGTLDDMIEFGYAAGPPRPIKDLLSTVGGPFCYVYL